MSDTATGFSRFASPAVKQAIARRVNEILGILLGFAGLALLVAVGTHHPGDRMPCRATWPGRWAPWSRMFCGKAAVGRLICRVRCFCVGRFG